jgi:hypothetical protein
MTTTKSTVIEFKGERDSTTLQCKADGSFVLGLIVLRNVNELCDLGEVLVALAAEINAQQALEAK